MKVKPEGYRIPSNYNFLFFASFYIYSMFLIKYQASITLGLKGHYSKILKLLMLIYKPCTTEDSSYSLYECGLGYLCSYLLSPEIIIRV